MTGSMYRAVLMLGGLLVLCVPPSTAQQVTVLSGGTATLQNGGRMGLSATLSVDGTLAAPGSTLRFERDGDQSLTGTNGALTVTDVVVDKLTGALQLGTNIFVRGLLDVRQGDVNLRGHTIDLGASGTLRERAGQTVTGTTGTITARRTLNAPSAQNVAGLGAAITSGADLGTTVVTRGHTVQSDPESGNEGIARYYDITPTTNAGLDATLTFSYDESELNGYEESVLTLFRSGDGGTTWTDEGGTLDMAANTITLSGIDAFSRWTLGSSSTPLPVELTSFEATVDGFAVLLRWQTASETNNAGFEVQRSRDEGQEEGDWQVLGFVEGAGTTAEPQDYTYRVAEVASGTHRFRLKQIDFDGAFDYSPEVEVAIAVPGDYLLTPAYPNPFNPQTQFSLGVARAQDVRIEVFDALGRRVDVLFDGPMASNQSRAFVFDAAMLPSGLYVIRVGGERFVETQHVVLVK